MDGLENLARNLGTYSASTDGMLLQKPTVTYGVLMDDDDNLYSNMNAIFMKAMKKKSRATESASAKPVTAKVKPVTENNKRAVTKPPVCSKLDKSSVLIKNSTALELWEEAWKIKTTSNDIKYAGNKLPAT